MADREIRVLALASKAAGLAPGQRYRFEQWSPHLERDHGISIDLLPFESPRLSEILYKPGHLATKAVLVGRDFLRRAEVVEAARTYDAILIYREASLIGPAIYERLLARSGKPLILDFDDAIWSAAQAHMNGLFSRLHALPQGLSAHVAKRQEDEANRGCLAERAHGDQNDEVGNRYENTQPGVGQRGAEPG